MAREMKDSGIEWIGEIPVNYLVEKIKHLGSFRNGLTYSPEDIVDESQGTLVLRSSNIQQGKLSFDDNVYVNTDIPERLKVQKGDIIICSRNGSRELIGKCAIIEDDLVASFGAFMMVFRGTSSKYMYYILNSDIFKYYLNTFLTSTINQLTGSNFGNMAIVWCGDKDEQERIVEFLDTECSHIDSVIEQTRASIEEYKKLKQAVITQAVTKGIRPDRPMKDGGVEWIGEMPTDWELLPFRRVLNERNEKNAPVITTERLSLSIDLGVTLYAEKTTNLDRFKDDFEQYKIAHAGDLVMNSMNMIVGATGVSPYFGCVSPAYYTFYDNEEDHVTAKFCEYIFRSKTMLRVLYSLGKGIYAIVRGDDRVNTCRLKVSRDDLRSIRIPIPSISEQREIVSYLDQKSKEIDELIKKKEKAVEELDSYKKSLIYEYVTGKKEVPA